MNDDDLDQKLRTALRAVDPPRDISAIVAARLQPTRGKAATWRRSWIWPASLAASLLLVAGYQYQRGQQEVSAGLEARRQLIEALHVTNEKLDLAFRAVREQNPKRDDKESGV